MAQRALRENTVPAGGATIPQVGGVAAGGMLLPDTIQAQELADLFFENSEQNYLQLNNVALVPGRQSQFQLQNVGLGEGLELMITGTFGLRNTTGGSVTVDVAPEFPFNIIQNLQIMFNGKVALANLSGYELLRIMLKRRFINGSYSSFNAGLGALTENFRLDRRLANVVVTGGTPVAGEGLTGLGGITIAAAATATVTFEMYLDYSFLLRKDLPFGLVPMQHNAIYANVTLAIANLIGTTWDFPFRTAAAVVVTDTAPVLAINCLPTYNFWGLPRDPNLYQFFVNNSYVLTSLPRNPIASIGARAIAFDFPLNYWLISMMLTIRQSGEQLINARNLIDNGTLVYNGTIHVDRSDRRTRVAREMLQTGRQLPFGTVMYDGALTNNLEGNSLNMSRWLNMYQANNPTYFADVLAGFTVPGVYDVLLEQLIPNYVTVI